MRIIFKDNPQRADPVFFPRKRLHRPQTTHSHIELMSIMTDLLTAPEPLLESVSKNQQFVLGDLHANILLLCQFLIKTGAMQLSSDAASARNNYIKLAQIYYLQSYLYDILFFSEDLRDDIQTLCDFPEERSVDKINKDYQHYTKLLKKIGKGIEQLQTFLEDKDTFKEVIGTLQSNLNHLNDMVKIVFSSKTHDDSSETETEDSASSLDSYEENLADQIFILAKTQDDFKKLIKNLLAQYKDMLDSAEFDADACLRLIGDELCDRGVCDWMVLLLLEKVKVNTHDFTILLSNHTLKFMTFLDAYITDPSNELPNFEQEIIPQFKSIKPIVRLLKNGLLNVKDLQRVFNNVYPDSLKLFDYSVTTDFKQVTLYSHAPSGLASIKKIATFLELPYEANDVLLLIELIDAINYKFQAQVKEHGFTNADGDAIYNFVWNRNYTTLQMSETLPDGTELHYCHGHDHSKFSFRNKTCIDGELGKSLSLRRGELLFFRAAQTTATLQLLMKSDFRLKTPLSTRLAKLQEEHQSDKVYSKLDEILLRKLIYLNCKWHELINEENSLLSEQYDKAQMFDDLFKKEKVVIEQLLVMNKSELFSDIAENFEAIEEYISPRLTRTEVAYFSSPELEGKKPRYRPLSNVGVFPPLDEEREPKNKRQRVQGGIVGLSMSND